MDIFFIKSVRVDHSLAHVTLEVELDDVSGPHVLMLRKEQAAELEAKLGQSLMDMAIARGQVVTA